MTNEERIRSLYPRASESFITRAVEAMNAEDDRKARSGYFGILRTPRPSRSEANAEPLARLPAPAATSPQTGKKARKPKADPGPLEREIQTILVRWWDSACWDFALPHFALIAIPNGGARDERTGAKLKGEGVRKGVWDMFLLVPRGAAGGLWIENKRRKGKVRPDQEAFGKFIVSQRYETGVVRSFAEGKDLIIRYLQGTL